MNGHATKGAVAESAVIAALTDMGYVCSLPIVHAARYDLVVEIDSLIKIQVKHAYTGADGKLRTELRGRDSYRGKKPYTADEVDVFAVYDGESVYWIPFEEAPSTGIKRPAEWYQQYELSTQLPNERL